MFSFNYLIRAAFSLSLIFLKHLLFYFYCFFAQILAFKSKNYVPGVIQERPLCFMSVSKTGILRALCCVRSMSGCVTLHCSFVRCCYWWKLSREYMPSLWITSYNHKGVSNFLKIKSFFKKNLKEPISHSH